MKKISHEVIQKYKMYLIECEKSSATLNKYVRDIKVFFDWIGEQEVTKQKVIEYKQKLMNTYAPASSNSILSSLNSFFSYMQWHECRVKTIKIQKQIFSKKDRELSKAEYERLLSASITKRNKKLYMIMQTICSTGIRVSELKFITTDAVLSKEAIINCKGKIRVVILPHKLCKALKKYINENRIVQGAVFVSKSGNPLDRSNIWKMMKTLCETANVAKNKVFPHNLRHLFARTYYSVQKDVVRLADILGHSSINTTRVYTKEAV